MSVRRRAALALRWLGLPLLLALAAWALRHADWRELWSRMSAARPSWLAAALLAQLLVLLLWAGLWRSLLRAGERVRFTTLLGTVTATGAAMLLLPSLAGQASAGALLVRRCGLRIGAAASLLLGEQVAEAAAKATVLLLALAFAPLPPQVRPAARLAALLFGGAVCLALLFSWSWRRARDLLRHPGTLLRSVAIALCIKVAEAGVFVAVQRSLGVVLHPSAILLLVALAALGIVAGTLLPVPGPIGVGEAVVAAGYLQLGLPLELALALVALHAATLLLPRLGGAAALLLADVLRPPAAASPAPDVVA